MFDIYSLSLSRILFDLLSPISRIITHGILRLVSISRLITHLRPTGPPSRLCPKKRPEAVVSTSRIVNQRSHTIRLNTPTAPTILRTHHTTPNSLHTLHTLRTPTHSQRIGRTWTVKSSAHQIRLHAPAQPTDLCQTLPPTISHLGKDLTAVDSRAHRFILR